MKKFCLLTLFLFAFTFLSTSIQAQAHFDTSLHGTRNGKSFWYGKDNGGFENMTNVPIDSLGCKNCHGPTNADGVAYDENNPYPGPGCNDCHPTGNFNKDALNINQCYGCHSRQAVEAKKMQLPDVHRDAGMVCWDCHTADDMHGDSDGTTYNSMLEPGAIDVECTDCHTADAGTLPDHSKYDPHNGKLHCAACHARTVITCYNCHFESMLDAHIKRAYKPLNDFVLLVNREKDGKVYPASFQSLTYQDTAFIAIAPFTPHSIMAKGRTCPDCHNNANVQEYFNSGMIKFATWNSNDSTLSWKHGVVPIPPDFQQSFRMDFLTYTGDTHDPAVPSKKWKTIEKDTWDGYQMFFATPLTQKQMELLSKAMPVDFPNSLHGTREGKEYWYSKTNGGFETITNIPIDTLGCKGCHGPTDADGVAWDASNPYPGPNCYDCHPKNSNFEPDSIKVSTCLGCHGRLATERVKLGYTDVHLDSGMVCWDCHTYEDMHGESDGTVYNSMLEPGAIDADCENCHTDLPASHANKDPHNGKLYCTACHAQTVITCYSCHFESQVEANLKRAKQPITGYMMLATREKDGKIGPATFMSLTYQGHTFTAFAPYMSHTITKTGARTCTDCHANFGGQVEAIQQYNSTGIMKIATWNTDSTLSWIHGVIPIPEDYRHTLKMDYLTYNGDPHDPLGPSKNWSVVKSDWDAHQMFFISPLTKEQMSKLGFDTTLTAIADNGSNQIPTEFRLEQNYPNPFNPSTTIEFKLPKVTRVTLKIFNLLGEEVVTLVNNRKMKPGTYKMKFDARNLASGIYFYQLKTPEFTQSRKMVLMK